jgi:uncharacterized protein
MSMRTALAALAFGLMSATVPAGAADRVTAIGVMADTADDLALAMRIAAALDHQNGLRILPIAGKGPSQTLNDLVHLKGVDAAVLPSDTLAYAAKEGLLDVAPTKLTYVLKLASQDVYLLARKDIDSLSALAGRRVAMGTTADSAYIAAHLLVQAAGITAEDVPLTGEAAVAAVADGSVDAAFLAGPNPLPVLATLKAKDLHLVPLEATGDAAAAYAPALVSGDDYPALLRKGETVETVSSALILAVFEWPRGSDQSKAIGRFAEGLFQSLEPAGSPDPGVNFTAAVPGWTRARVADDVLAARAARAQAIQPAKSEN